MTVTKQLKITQLAVFDRELKKLSKKYKNIQEDLESLAFSWIKTVDFFKTNQLMLTHIEKIDNGAVFKIPKTGIGNPIFFKVKKFHSEDFPGKGVKSGIRLIYAYYPEEKKVEFIQIYYKEKDDTNHDVDRIKKYYGSH